MRLFKTGDYAALLPTQETGRGGGDEEQQQEQESELQPVRHSSSFAPFEVHAVRHGDL
jgi:hypothetical protein